MRLISKNLIAFLPLLFSFYTVLSNNSSATSTHKSSIDEKEFIRYIELFEKYTNTKKNNADSIGLSIAKELEVKFVELEIRLKYYDNLFTYACWVGGIIAALIATILILNIYNNIVLINENKRRFSNVIKEIERKRADIETMAIEAEQTITAIRQAGQRNN